MFKGETPNGKIGIDCFASLNQSPGDGWCISIIANLMDIFEMLRAFRTPQIPIGAHTASQQLNFVSDFMTSSVPGHPPILWGIIKSLWIPESESESDSEPQMAPVSPIKCGIKSAHNESVCLRQNTVTRD